MFSIGAALLLFGGLLPQFALYQLPLHFPLSCSFLFVTSFTSLITRPWRAQVVLSKELINFFLFQYCLLLGMCFELQLKELILMASLPVVSALYAINSHPFWRQEEKRLKAYGVVFVVFCSLPLPLYSLSFPMDPAISLGWCYGAFFSWQLGLFFLASVDGKRDGEPWQERYFFHDAINLTHGLTLFLRGRLTKGEGISPQEVEDVLGEVRSWQNLLQNYFGMGHKNIKSDESQNLGEIIQEMNRVISFFNDDSDIEIFSHYSGRLEDHSKGHYLKQIDFPSSPLLRIFTNLLKNSLEAGSMRVEIVHGLNDFNYTLMVKNEIMAPPRKSYELAKILENQISNQSQKAPLVAGYGLEAIDSLVQNLGGKFHFTLEGQVWKSEVVIPHHTHLMHLSGVAKKVA